MLLKIDCLPNAVGNQPSIPLIYWKKVDVKLIMMMMMTMTVAKKKVELVFVFFFSFVPFEGSSQSDLTFLYCAVCTAYIVQDFDCLEVDRVCSYIRTCRVSSAFIVLLFLFSGACFSCEFECWIACHRTCFFHCCQRFLVGYGGDFY